MFWLTVLWLALLGAGLHLLQDVISFDSETGAGRYDALAYRSLTILAALTPLFLLEVLLHRSSPATRSPGSFWTALFPPLRLGGRDHVDGGTLWLPVLGWVAASDELERRLERHLSIPMIVIALLVLPVMAVDFLGADQIRANPQLGLINELAGAFIWLAFAVEFLVMISIVREKPSFLRQHWLDLAIICLPVIAFLRVFRVGRLLRLNQLTKVSRTARAFRFRTVLLRFWRALLVLQVIDRLVHRDDERRLARLERLLREKECEVVALRAEVDTVRARLEAARKPAGGNQPDDDSLLPEAVVQPTDAG